MTPTQAQIEAAARALCRQYQIEDGYSIETADKSAASEMHKNFIASAKAALTAAAEAGEQREPDEMCLRVGHKWIIECQRCGDNRTVQSEIIATIERCAQVAFKHMTEMDGEATPEGTAAAIRALKDKP